MVTYGQDPATISESYQALFQWVSGWPDKSRAASERAITQALELDHVGTLGPVLSWGGQITQVIRRDAEGLRRTCGHLRALTSHHKMPIWETVEQLANAELEAMDKPSYPMTSHREKQRVNLRDLPTNVANRDGSICRVQ